MTDRLAALRMSTDHLHTLGAGLDVDALRRPAYPGRMDRGGRALPSGLQRGDLPRPLRRRGARPNRSHPIRRRSGRPGTRSRPRRRPPTRSSPTRRCSTPSRPSPTNRASTSAASLGPLEVDFDGFVGLRLNEHLVHTWDVEVADDPTATLLPVPVPFVLDSLAPLVRWTGRPEGSDTIRVHTDDPRRDLTVSLGPDTVTLTSSEDATAPDLVLPGEAFVRLVYGRLDPDHTPAASDADVIARLRAVFPGP